MELFENTNFQEATGALRIERLNRFRRAHAIGVRGSDVSEPLTSFADLADRFSLEPNVLRALELDFGFKEPTAVQRQTIPLMLERRELLVCAPTGSGKTLGFLLPILAHAVGRLSRLPPSSGSDATSPVAVLLAPTVELAMQTFKVALRLSKSFSEDLVVRMESCSGSIRQLRAQLAAEKKKEEEKEEENGSGGRRRQKASRVLARRLKAKMAHLTASLKGTHVLVTTPQRLLDVMETGALKLDTTDWLLLDEADRLFEDANGCHFRDQLAPIFKACTSPQARRALFSATTRPDVEEWARLTLDNIVSVRIGHRNAAGANVQQSLTYCGEESGKLHEMRMLLVRGLKFPCLIFLQSRERARLLHQELAQKDVAAGVLSGDLSQKQREKVMEAFRSQKLLALICTDLLSRGIDVPNVQMVINYDLPPTPLEYVHRVGRTGRAGKRGAAITFWTDKDFAQLRPIAHLIREAGGTVPPELNNFLHKVARQSGKKKRLHLPTRGDLKGRGARRFGPKERWRPRK